MKKKKGIGGRKKLPAGEKKMHFNVFVREAIVEALGGKDEVQKFIARKLESQPLRKTA